jgi:hypothetical protein
MPGGGPGYLGLHDGVGGRDAEVAMDVDDEVLPRALTG